MTTIDPHTWNQQAYSSADVVALLEEFHGLTAAEERVFRYVRSGDAVLDLGVGCGRTTPFLAGIAGRYIGADYAEPMIAQCRKRYPELDFRVMDASEPWALEPGSLDAVILSFNTIDYLLPQHRRHRFLENCCQALRPGGHLIFSTHNPRGIAVWWPVHGRTLPGKVYIFFRNVWYFLRWAVVLLCSRAFWTGEGDVVDPFTGALRTHTATPEHVIAETQRFGFDFVEQASSRLPAKGGALTSCWFYYVFRRK